MPASGGCPTVARPMDELPLPGVEPARAPASADVPAAAVTVAVMAPLPHPLTYLVPPGVPTPLPGTRVLCPLGSREVTGVVLDAPASATAPGLRPLSQVLDEHPLWGPDLRQTVQFCADYYLAPLGDVVRAALPPGLTPRSTRAWHLTAHGKLALAAPQVAGLDALDAQILATVGQQPRAPAWLQRTLKVGPGRLARLAARGLLEDPGSLKGAARTPTVTMLAPVVPPPQPLPSRGPALAAVDAYLRAQGRVSLESVLSRFPRAHAPVKRLVALGRITREEQPAQPTDPYAAFPAPPAPRPQDLTGEQRHAIAAVCAAMDGGTSSAFLLQGITGSGKTEVYLQLVAHARAQGRTALVLVPEIALTPALAARFRGRVEGGVAVLHSGLTPSERLAAYDAARAGRVGAVLGARSAVFAPLPNLGLLVVDEEHEGSFKQEESPRYQARDLALYRGRAAGAAVVLGSATPSLESLHGATTGRLVHLRLTQRPLARPLPHVQLVDLRTKSTAQNPAARTTPLTSGARVTILGPALLTALEGTLASGHQALIFLNRRGYSTSVLCRGCGLPLACPSCAVALTHHAPRTAVDQEQPVRAGTLRCHYCDHTEAVPQACPACGSAQLYPLGLGIQRVEAELAARFPRARLGRLDRDAVQKRGALERTLSRFASGQTDVLVGTQMLAKGHDYPGVTLVGVVAADVGLRMPDWRAAERTLQLLTQVAGRAGRGNTPGNVIIQTWCPEHPALVCAASHDVDGFAAQEMPLRQQLNYPPFGRLAMVRAEAPTEPVAQALATAAAGALQAAARRLGAADSLQVLGPAPAPLARLRGIWRMQVLLKASSPRPRQAALRQMLQQVRPPTGARLVVDVDPGSML